MGQGLPRLESRDLPMRLRVLGTECWSLSVRKSWGFGEEGGLG